MARYTPILATSGVITILLTRLLPHLLFVGPVTTFICLVSTLSLARAFYYIIIWPRFVSPLRHLPGPERESYFMGHGNSIINMPIGEPHKAFLKIPNDGLIRYHTLWNREHIMPTNARVLQQALTTDIDIWVKPPQMRLGLGRILGSRSVLFAEGEEHKAHRRIMNPAFSRKQIKNLVPVFWEKAVYLGDKVASEAPKQENAGWLDMALWASLGTLDIIGAAGLGYDFRAMETGGNGSEIARAYNVIFTQRRGRKVMQLLMTIFPNWLLKNIPIKRNIEMRAAHASIVSACHELIRTKRQELKSQTAGDEKDILSVMINSSYWDAPSTGGDDGIQEQLMTFLAAGHETTSTLVQWALHLLTLHPQYQTLLRTELRNKFPTCPSPAHMTYEILDSLPLLRNFTQEVIRFYPPVALTMREAARATTLDGHPIPAGTTLVIVPWALQKDPKVWGPDADEFRPERWEGRTLDSNYDILTFLAGPRICIGKDFARMEFMAIMAVLMARFTFESTGREIEIQGGITSRPKGGLKLKVTEVGGW